MSETLTLLSETLQEIERLENELEANPSVETAAHLSASKQVALALGRKHEREEAEQKQEAQDEKRAEFEAKYAEIQTRLFELHEKAEAALNEAIDATDESFDLLNQSRRLASMITKTGGHACRCWSAASGPDTQSFVTST